MQSQSALLYTLFWLAWLTQAQLLPPVLPLTTTSLMASPSMVSVVEVAQLLESPPPGYKLEASMICPHSLLQGVQVIAMTSVASVNLTTNNSVDIGDLSALVGAFSAPFQIALVWRDTWTTSLPISFNCTVQSSFVLGSVRATSTATVLVLATLAPSLLRLPQAVWNVEQGDAPLQIPLAVATLSSPFWLQLTGPLNWIAQLVWQDNISATSVLVPLVSQRTCAVLLAPNGSLNGSLLVTPTATALGTLPLLLRLTAYSTACLSATTISTCLALPSLYDTSAYAVSIHRHVRLVTPVLTSNMSFVEATAGVPTAVAISVSNFSTAQDVSLTMSLPTGISSSGATGVVRQMLVRQSVLWNYGITWTFDGVLATATVVLTLQADASFSGIAEVPIAVSSYVASSGRASVATTSVMLLVYGRTFFSPPWPMPESVTTSGNGSRFVSVAIPPAASVALWDLSHMQSIEMVVANGVVLRPVLLPTTASIVGFTIPSGTTSVLLWPRVNFTGYDTLFWAFYNDVNSLHSLSRSRLFVSLQLMPPTLDASIAVVDRALHVTLQSAGTQDADVSFLARLVIPTVVPVVACNGVSVVADTDYQTCLFLNPVPGATLTVIIDASYVGIFGLAVMLTTTNGVQVSPPVQQLFNVSILLPTPPTATQWTATTDVSVALQTPVLNINNTEASSVELQPTDPAVDVIYQVVVSQSFVTPPLGSEVNTLAPVALQWTRYAYGTTTLQLTSTTVVVLWSHAVAGQIVSSSVHVRSLNVSVLPTAQTPVLAVVVPHNDSVWGPWALYSSDPLTFTIAVSVVDPTTTVVLTWSCSACDRVDLNSTMAPTIAFPSSSNALVLNVAAFLSPNAVGASNLTVIATANCSGVAFIQELPVTFTVYPVASPPVLRLQTPTRAILEGAALVLPMTVQNHSMIEVVSVACSIIPAAASASGPPKWDLTSSTLSVQLVPIGSGVVAISCVAVAQIAAYSYPRSIANASISTSFPVLPVAHAPLLTAAPTQYTLTSRFMQLPILSSSLATARSPTIDIWRFQLHGQASMFQVCCNSSNLNIVASATSNGIDTFDVRPNAPLYVATIGANDGGSFSLRLSSTNVVPTSNTSATTSVLVQANFVGNNLTVSPIASSEGDVVMLTLSLFTRPQATLGIYVVCNDTSQVAPPSAQAMSPSTYTPTVVYAMRTARDFVDRPTVYVRCRVQLSTSDPWYAYVPMPSVVFTIGNIDRSALVLVGPTLGGRLQLAVGVGGAGDVFTVALATMPSGPVVVSFSSSGLVTTPTTAVFSSTNWNSPQTIVVSAPAGLALSTNPFLATLQVQSASSMDVKYAALTPSSVAVTIVDAPDMTPPPRLLSAMFADSGASLIVTFSRAVDLSGFSASSFVCDRVFETARFGLGPVCTWTTTSTVVIGLGLGATVVPLAPCTVLAGLKSTSTSTLSMASMTVSVQPPLNAPVPVVSIAGATSLGACDDLVLDATATSGSGGRPMAWRWACVVELTQQPCNGSLAQISASTQAIRVPATELIVGVGYRIHLNCTNYFGLSGASTLLVTKSTSALPSVYMDGPSAVRVAYSNPIVLSGVAVAPTCNSSSSDSAALQLSWTIREAAAPTSTSRNPRQVIWPARSLPPGTYTVSFQAATSSGGTNTAIVALEIVRSGLVATIVGGSSRTVGAGVDLVLNGSLSHDPDAVGSNPPLTFFWNCTNPSTGALLALLNGTTPVVPKSFLAVGTTLFVTLTVSDANTNRQESTSTTITVVAGTPPMVEIAPLNQANLNANFKILLQGNVRNSVDPAPIGAWSVANDASGQLATAFFAVPSVHRFYGKRGPTSVAVTPTSGVALTTVFTLTSRNWVGVALPLRFAFKYIRGLPTDTGAVEVPLCEYSLTTSWITTLPAGVNGSVTIVGYVVDVFGAVAKEYATIQVAALPTASTVVLSQATSLEAKALHDDPSAVLSTATQLAAALPSAVVDPNAVCSTTGQAVCSGHGSCALDPPACHATDANCVASCVCTANWFAHDCSASAETLQAQQAALGSLLNAVATAALSINPTVESLEQQSAALYSIAANADLLSSSQAAQTFGLLLDVLAPSSMTLLSSTALTTLGGTISSLLELSGATIFTDSASTVVDMLATALLVSAVPGEAPATLVTPNLRLAVRRVHPALAAAGSTLSVPQMTSQIAQQAATTSLTLPAGLPLASTCTLAIDTHMKLFRRNLYASSDNASLTSGVLGIDMYCDYATTPASVANLSRPMQIRMAKLQPQVPSVVPSRVSASYNCVVGSNETIVTPCAEPTILACNGSANYTIQYTCPRRRHVPSCQYWNASARAWASDGCVVVADDTDAITCNCTHLTDFGTQIVEAFDAVQLQVVETLSVRITPELIEANAAVPITLGVFCGLYLLSLHLSLQWDAHDALVFAKEQRRRRDDAQHLYVPPKLYEPPEFVVAPTRRARLRAFCKSVWAGLKDNHKVLEMFFHYDPHYTRPQRVMVLFTAAMSELLMNAILYKLRALTPNAGTTVVSGTVSSICMLPVTIAFILLFKKSGARDQYVLRLQLEDDTTIVEVQVDAYGNPVDESQYCIRKRDHQELAANIPSRDLQIALSHLRRVGVLEANGMPTLAGHVSMAVHSLVSNRADSDASDVVDAGAAHVARVMQDARRSAKVAVQASTEDEVPVVEVVSDAALPMLLAMWGQKTLHAQLTNVEPAALSEATLRAASQHLEAAVAHIASLPVKSLGPIPADEVRVARSLVAWARTVLASADAYIEDAQAMVQRMATAVENAKLELLEARALLTHRISFRRRLVLHRRSRRYSIDKVARVQRATAMLQSVVKRFKQSRAYAAHIEREERQRIAAQEREIVQHLHGLARYRKRLQLYLEATEARRLAALPLHERQRYEAEQAKVRSLSAPARALYNTILRQEASRIEAPVFPPWVHYILYGMCAGVAAFAIYFVLLFSLLIGANVALHWVGSVVAGLVLTHLVTEPIGILLRVGVLPLLATVLLNSTGIFEMLGAETVSWGAAAAVGVAGVTRLTRKGALVQPVDTSSLVVSPIRPGKVTAHALQMVHEQRRNDGAADPSPAELAAEIEAASATAYKARWTAHVSGDAEPPVAMPLVEPLRPRSGPPVVHVPAAGGDTALFPAQILVSPDLPLVAPSVSDDSVLCRLGCGARVRRIKLESHETHLCPERPLVCPSCNVSIAAAVLASHECRSTPKRRGRLPPLSPTLLPPLNDHTLPPHQRHDDLQHQAQNGHGADHGVLSIARQTLAERRDVTEKIERILHDTAC
ncbi:hypothetical protein SDRG_09960 [Saprolegnia diclina VS20]|uniref:GAIN-B domain-containing protein n=1 Tax=Saprolegnia diclina (strain VS20) TaxID=1156394 RepID=T0RIM1_SAPDV|nr:hypothetical protein SDRG_09960 [Saprolegnia diclina VS20]EQC32208.1 hypothetical protein SDRG_09960 [Saprolegnia diclina VS20]|eukprot:XP_008614149.1 hypothetical protein SDRG_09960 [Saprolegnia diclina VS20]